MLNVPAGAKLFYQLLYYPMEYVTLLAGLELTPHFLQTRLDFTARTNCRYFYWLIETLVAHILSQYAA